MGAGWLRDAEGLAAKIAEQLRINQEVLGVRCEEPGPEGCFAEFIRRARANFGERVVVLVDEYDKPILDNVSDPPTARVMRDGLRNLYSVIKDSDAHSRFAFLTGVRKFSKVSLFSGLIQPRDALLAGLRGGIPLKGNRVSRHCSTSTVTLLRITRLSPAVLLSKSA